jgi:hypothetical protein
MFLVITTKTYVDGKLTKSATDTRPWHNDGKDLHARCTSPDTLRFFRALGATERVTYGWTLAGKIITKLVSISPDKRTRTIRTFDITREES